MSPNSFDPMKDINNMMRIMKGSADFGNTIGAWFLKRQLQREGRNPITISAAVEARKAGNHAQVEAILYADNKAIAAGQKKQALLKNPPPIHGDSRFASKTALKEVTHVANAAAAPGSLYFGEHDDTGEPLHWDGEGHLLTVAPTRTGKSAVLIIPNLLRYRGSAVVLDPKGELYQATADWRRENVGEVYVVDPFKIVGDYSDSFNPLDAVKDDKTARKIAEMIYPVTGDKKQQFFENEAISLLTAIIYYCSVYAPVQYRSLAVIRDLTAADDNDFKELLKGMDKEENPASIRNPARTFDNKHPDAKKRVLDSFETHMQIWDTQALRDISSRTDFDFEGLKDEKATVYLVMPFDDLKAFSTYIQGFFSAALSAMITNRNKPDIPVLFVLDEFLALDAAEHFSTALHTHAGSGVRLWFFVQDIATLRQRYDDLWETFLDVEVKVFFGTQQKETSEYISEYLGHRTEAVPDPTSGTISLGGSGSSYSVDEKYSYHKVALMTPDQVERFMASNDKSKPRMGIVFMGGGHRIKTKLIPWVLDPVAKARCGLKWTERNG